MTPDRTVPFDLVDVFAAGPLEGNLLPVVHDSDGIPSDVMERLAVRFRLSETSFVQAATTREADYRHRIFTIGGEVPFAGHPSLGTAAAVVRRRGVRSATVVQETGVGLQRLEVSMRDGDAWVSLEQPEATFGATLAAEPLMAGLGLTATDAHPAWPPQLGTVGLQALLVPLREPSALGRIAVDWSVLGPLIDEVADASTISVYVAAEERPGAWRARMFAVDIAGGEDPATGSAAGPLGVYVASHGGGDHVEILQGQEMGQPSHLTVDVRDARPIVAGPVRFLGEGTLTLPTVGPIDR